MIEARDHGSRRCPDCNRVIPERDPLVGWWLCDGCGFAIADDGNTVT
ncbi:hypothetical protein [Natrinema gelatinilyticum]|nr:hypothetical protein [Natrinema gelatinilyticum]